MISQLVLSLGFRPKFHLEDFVFGVNSTLASALLSSLKTNQQPLIFISGKPNSGRSHILIGQCEAAEQHSLTSIYIPLRQKSDFTPAILEDLEQYDLVVLDDIDEIAGDKEWEGAIFHLFNQLRDNEKRLLVSANSGPSSLNIKLADLATRLRWGLSFHLQDLSDVEQQALIKELAKRKGLQLSDEVARYLLQHYPRDTQQLISQLEKLDKASLQAKRKPTIPFIRQILG